MHNTIALGRFNDALQWARAINEVCKRRGWTEFRVLVPSFGAVNQFILEAEYPDHAAFFRENESFQSDREAMTVYRGGVDIVARDCLTAAVRDEIVAGTCTHGDSGGTPQKGARASKPVS